MGEWVLISEDAYNASFYSISAAHAFPLTRADDLDLRGCGIVPTEQVFRRDIQTFSVFDRPPHDYPVFAWHELPAQKFLKRLTACRDELHSGS